MQLHTLNPANEEAIQSYETFSDQQVDDLVTSVNTAFIDWRALDVAQRCHYLVQVADELEAEVDELARLITLEMGKPITEAEGEVKKCAAVCRYYAENAANFLADETLPADTQKCFVSFEPLGIVCGVMPWNFPFWQVFRYAAPTLAAGNACLLKHAANTTGCALAIERVFERAGLPENVFRTLLVSHDQFNALIARREIAAVTLTGSTAAGSKVAESAGRALKKTVLELGGSDPYLVLDDADLELAAKACAQSRLINSGQSCIAAKRFIVEDAVRNMFEEAFVEQLKMIQPGDPTKKDTKLGPLARADIREDLHKQVQQSLNAGARSLLGGELPQGKGFYYAPTVLTDVNEDCAAFNEELFGPVAAIIPARDQADAVRLANSSVYGLGSAVFSRDLDRAERVARQLEAGCCFVNDFVRSDPMLPFGGVKESGYGRELSHYGIREFVNIKTVWISG